MVAMLRSQPDAGSVVEPQPAARPNVTEYVVRGNTNQMQDKAFMKELKAWLRFSEADAVATMDGLFSRASGNPLFAIMASTSSTKLHFYRER
jgi:hypothetical protein